MVYNSPTVIIILCYMISISVAVALAALFSLSDSLLTILLGRINNYCILSYCRINTILPCFLRPGGSGGCDQLRCPHREQGMDESQRARCHPGHRQGNGGAGSTGADRRALCHRWWVFITCHRYLPVRRKRACRDLSILPCQLPLPVTALIFS